MNNKPFRIKDAVKTLECIGGNRCNFMAIASIWIIPWQGVGSDPIFFYQGV